MPTEADNKSPGKIVTDAVRWRLFDLNVGAAQAHNADVASEQLEDVIEQALFEVRAERFAKRG
jgi:hypothetical protein